MLDKVEVKLLTKFWLTKVWFSHLHKSRKLTKNEWRKELAAAKCNTIYSFVLLALTHDLGWLIWYTALLFSETIVNGDLWLYLEADSQKLWAVKRSPEIPFTKKQLFTFNKSWFHIKGSWSINTEDSRYKAVDHIIKERKRDISASWSVYILCSGIKFHFFLFQNKDLKSSHLESPLCISTDVTVLAGGIR